MADTKVVQISGVAHPSRRMRMLAQTLHGDRFARNVDSMLQDAVATKALAGALDRAMAASTSSDGRLDLQVMAAHLMRDMKDNQK